MATRVQLHAKSTVDWIAGADRPAQHELIVDLTSQFLKIGTGVDLASELLPVRPSRAGVHKELHRFDGSDPLSLSLLSPQVGDALPTCGINDPLVTEDQLQDITPYRGIEYVSGSSLTPVHNTHYILTMDTTFSNPTIVSGKLFSASVLVPAGILVSFPNTWKLSGSVLGNVATVLTITATSLDTVHVECVKYPSTYTSNVPEIVYVSSTGDDANDGLSWATAKQTVDAGAILARTKSNILWIKTGTYTAIRDEGFNLTGLSVYGGFAGTESSIAERAVTTPGGGTQAPIMTNPTVLRNPTASRATAYAVITGGSTTLYNVTISSSVCAVLGGTTLVECIITGNNGATRSPVISCVLWYCTLSSNTCSTHGGAARFCNTYGCRFESNTVSGGDGGGGAVYGGTHRYGTFVSNQVLNSSSNYGGAGMGGTYRNCTFTSNYASNNGGALAAPTSLWVGIDTLVTTAVDCTFNSNTSNWHGGGTSGVNCTRCTFNANSATNTASAGAYGGGASGGTHTNCTFTYNVTYQSGGGTTGATTINCIFIANRATSGQGGSAIAGGTHYNPLIARHGWTSSNIPFYGSPVIINGLLLHNSNVSGQGSGSYNNVMWRNGAGEVAGNNAILTGQLIVGNFVNALDVVANVPAGDIATFDARVLAHGYYTAAGSPVIGAGNNSYNTTSTDIRGRTRFVGTIDCGAYEYQA